MLLAALIAPVDILPVLDGHGVGTMGLIALIMGEVNVYRFRHYLYYCNNCPQRIEPRLVSMQIGLNPLVTLFLCFWIGTGLSACFYFR